MYNFVVEDCVAADDVFDVLVSAVSDESWFLKKCVDFWIESKDVPSLFDDVSKWR